MNSREIENSLKAEILHLKQTNDLKQRLVAKKKEKLEREMSLLQKELELCDLEIEIHDLKQQIKKKSLINRSKTEQNRVRNTHTQQNKSAINGDLVASRIIDLFRN